jgi:hypothetical protein
MRVSYLRDDAAQIFRLNAQDLVLMLFGLFPRTLEPQGRLSDTPSLGPESTVLVFNIAGMANQPYFHQPPPNSSVIASGSLTKP